MDFFDIILILINFAGALGIFLFGMKLMSEGLQKFAGNGMRRILGKITDNPVTGILTGALVTIAIQSSSATTVMVVSFVNAGLLSLSGAIAVIMGANIGTTATAWIITLLGLGESGGAFSFPLFAVAIALFFMFSKKDKLKSFSEFIVALNTLLPPSRELVFIRRSGIHSYSSKISSFVMNMDSPFDILKSSFIQRNQNPTTAISTNSHIFNGTAFFSIINFFLSF